MKKRRRRRRKKRKRKGENGESGTKSTPLSTDAFLGTKLENNITPIKGKLGKNTTPTGRGPSEPNIGPQSLGETP